MGDRLLWRCRRGMRELDVLVEGYYLDRYEQLESGGQADFRKLLEQSDPELLGWLLGRSEPPADLAALIEDMRQFKRQNRETGVPAGS
ncbi:MAG: succinate dehydrogenase assembly factor 2 [Pseudomonadota bacterium]